MQPTVSIEGFGSSAIGTIYAIGRNYAEHAKELGNAVPVGDPVVFLKAPSSARSLADGSLAFGSETFHFEAEVVLRIGQNVPMGSKNIDWSCVGSVGLGLDLTRREKQNELKTKGLPWTIAKSFTGASLLSPMIQCSELGSQQFFQFTLSVGGETKQTGDTRQMIFDVPSILKYLNSFNTLLTGDLIFTGTPAGVGPIRKGEHFTLEMAEPHRKWEGIL
jgi:2-keto-4-pentenoate hydratase/2-oxohepta-3-ene-1,7-dioic acid hydratase in catechol pathway